MPKVSKVIKQFEGGVNTFSDARDIADKTASAIKNFSVRHVGKLKPLGYFSPVGDGADTHAAGDLISEISAADGSGMHFDTGALFFPFSTDRTSTGTSSSEKWIAFVDKNTGKVYLHSKTLLENDTETWVHPNGSGAWLGMPLSLGAAMTSGDGSEPGYYVVDGNLRVCNHNVADSASTTATSATSLWFGWIERLYMGDGATNSADVGSWYAYPAPLVKPNSTTFKGPNAATFNEGVSTGPDCDPGQMAINVQITRNSGDGTLKMEGRQLYVTYTFDGKQETLPYYTDIIELGDLPAAPTPTELGYIANVSKIVSYGDTAIGLDEAVHTQSSGTLKKWEDSGTITVRDDQSQWQTLFYSAIVPGDTAGFANANGATLTAVSGWVDYGECAQGTAGHSTKAICDLNEDSAANHPGSTQWLPSDLSVGADVTFDPPGEIEERDENLGFRISLTFNTLTTGTDGEILADIYGGNRVTHVNFYTNRTEDGTLVESDYAFICSFDLVNGAMLPDGTFRAWGTADSVNTDQQIIDSDYYGSVFADSYQGRTGVFPDTKSLDIRWKTATVLNRRVYAGNVHSMNDAGVETHYPDRIMKSIPNRFDVFPSYDSMDVVVDDGDEIVLLENFGGQLLQFKKETLYILDVTSEPEFLSATHKYRGIPSQAAAARTDSGIIFANKSGAYLYNGQQVKQLVAGKFESEWEAFYDDTVCVGFHPRYNIGMFVKEDSPDFLVFDILTDSWVVGAGLAGGANDGYRIGSFDKGKFFVYDNELILAQEADDASSDSTIKTFNKWNDDFSTVTTPRASDYLWVSKDLDLGNPGTIKRIRRVKITYKTESGDGNAKVYLVYNNGTSTTPVQITSDGTDFADSAGEWLTQDFEVTPAVKCLSTKVKIINDGVLDEGFEINDISIVYRERPVK